MSATVLLFFMRKGWILGEEGENRNVVYVHIERKIFLEIYIYK